eukprot:gene8187-9032_t
MAYTFKVLFVGTGVSTAIPNIAHVLERSKGDQPCLVCQDAMTQPHSKNKRNNVSIALLFEEEGAKRCILVDVGKTMRDAVIHLLPKYDIEEVHGILITHGHADAMMGLDDVRDLQKVERVAVKNPKNPDEVSIGFRVLSGPLPIYLTQETMQTIDRVFPYLTGPSQYLDEAANVIERRVALLKYHVVDENAELLLHGLPVRCFPVWHGGRYVSLGFNFGAPGEFVYISDVKIIPEETWAYLRGIPKIKVLVLDALDREGIFSHIGLIEALAICDELKPEKAFFTGMCCEMGLHEEVEQELQAMGVNHRLAYDGLLLEGFQRLEKKEG